MSTRFRLDIGYQGTDFNGWAVQLEQRTVQGEIERSLGRIFAKAGGASRLVVAGRTDAGVHANGQVAHVDLTEDGVSLLHKQAVRRGLLSDADGHEVDAALSAQLKYRLNGILSPSPDVMIHRVSVAPEGFNARFSALWRSYEYRIADGDSVKDPSQRHRTLWLKEYLDGTAMNAGAASLVGLHNFAAFCRPRAGATTIRTLQEFHWDRDDRGVLVATVQADAFCHSMVRSLVGSCVAAGLGKVSGLDFERFLKEERRAKDFTVLGAHGLTLLEVGYPGDLELKARAAHTRRLRTIDAAEA